MKTLNRYGHIAPALFTLSIFGLVWRYGTESFLGITPKPFEILFSILLTFVLFDIFISEEGRILLHRIRPTLASYSALLGALLIFIILGSVFSFPGWIFHIKDVLIGFVNIIFSFIVFFVSAYTVVRNRDNLHRGLVALTLSPLVFLLAFIPKWQDFFINNARLIGAQNDPNITAIIIATGLILSSVFFLYSDSRLRLLSGLNVVFLVPLFLWADSRGANFSIALTLSLLAIFYLFKEASLQRVKAVFALFCIIFFSISAAYLVLPEDTRISIYSRSVVPTFPSESLNAFVLEHWVFRGDGYKYSTFDRNVSLDNFNLSRGDLWASALERVVKSPLGFGPAYHKWSPIGRDVGAHNTWLQVPLTTGWGGFLSWTVLLYLVFRAGLRATKKETLVGVALLAEFTFLLVSIVFIDAFTLKHLWLIMGMIVGYFLSQSNAEPKSIGASSDL